MNDIIYTWEIQWSGIIEEYVITIESLMKANNWNREKAKKHLEDMWEEIQNEQRNMERSKEI